jgi:signal transduction histidine kinase
MLAFLLRFLPQTSPELSFNESVLSAANLPETAAAHLAYSNTGWVSPHCEVARKVSAQTAKAIQFAQRFAEHREGVAFARIAVLIALAPLGWLAVASVNANAAHEPLTRLDSRTHAERQHELWGLDQNAVARRLAYRWRMPDWIATAIGNFNIPFANVRAILHDAETFAIAQFAIRETESRGTSLGLTHGANRNELLQQLDVSENTIDELWDACGEPASAWTCSAHDQNPHNVPLVANLLRMAGENRRRNGTALALRLEARIDELQAAIVPQTLAVEEQIHEAKLAALAELAAGAGHEINNPLAIISGIAQRLFRTEPDVERGESLQKIIGQTQRIAGILRDLMQFARPPQPNPQRVNAAETATAVRNNLQSLANDKKVRLELGAVPPDAYVRCDSTQLQHALVAIVRNGIEAAGAAGPDGWVRLRCEANDDETVSFVIEDSGPGLSASALAHAFDPFYCGRSAGRGRGLGLPTAWKFAKQNGGDLRYTPTANEPTRFVLSVPRSVTLDFADRQSA